MKTAIRRGRVAVVVVGLFVMALVFVLNPTHSADGYYATEFTQLLNNIELLHQTLKQADQLAAELQMLNNMVTNLKNIPDQVWSSIVQDLQGVLHVVQQGQALAFSASNISEEFKSKFPGFVQPLNYTASYKSWSDTARDSIRGSLAAAASAVRSTPRASRSRAMTSARARSAAR